MIEASQGFKSKSEKLLKSHPNKFPFKDFILNLPLQDSQIPQHSKSHALNKSDLAYLKYKDIISNNLIDVILNPKKEKPKNWFSYSMTIQKITKDYEREARSFIQPPDSLTDIIPSGLSSLKLFYEISLCRNLQVSIPETFIFGHGFETPTFLYCDSKGVKCVQKLSINSYEYIAKLLTKQRKIERRKVPPIGIYRGYSSVYNKLLMKHPDLCRELISGFNKGGVIQRYILTKGNISSKFRVVFKNEQIRVFRVSNLIRLDKQSVEKTEEKYDDSKNSFLQNSKASRLAERPRILIKSSFSSNPEKKEVTLEEYLDSISQEIVEEEMGCLIASIIKHTEKSDQVSDSVKVDETPVMSFSNQLKKMFCVYSRDESLSRVTELKSLTNFKPLMNAFSVIKDTINSAFLIQKNRKISYFICDFFEDTNKDLYFSQIKYCKCCEFIYVPLKVVMKKNKPKFKCPGKYCDKTLSSSQIEVFAEGILMNSKKVFPKVCKVLVGTILDEKFESIDNMQKLNPRLFERVQVCKNCYQIYTEQSRSLEDSKHPAFNKVSQSVTLDNTISDLKKHKLESIKRDPRKKDLKLTETNMLKTLALPQVKKSQESIFYQKKKRSIFGNIKLEEFIIN